MESKPSFGRLGMEPKQTLGGLGMEVREMDGNKNNFGTLFKRKKENMLKKCINTYLKLAQDILLSSDDDINPLDFWILQYNLNGVRDLLAEYHYTEKKPIDSVNET